MSSASLPAAANVTDVDLTVVVACYNEAEHLTGSVRELIETLDRAIWSYELVFVDDRSTDDTRRHIEAILAEHGDRVPMRAIFHLANTGRGRAVSDGMRIARGRMIGFLDIDLEVHARYIPAAIGALEAGADIVIAHRVYRIRLSPWFLMRHILSRGYRAVSNRIMRLGGLDTEAGFKFFVRGPLFELLDECHDPGWFWDTEIMCHARLRGLRIVELPCLFLRRTDKTSTLRVLPATIQYLRKLAEFRRHHGGGA